MPSMSRVVAAAFAALLSCSGAWAQQGTGQPADVPAAVSREAALVQFFGGGAALTPAEHDTLTRAVQTAFANDPNGAREAASASSEMLAVTQGLSPGRVTLGRQIGRRAIAFEGMQALGRGAEGQVAASIVTAHDPVVAIDPARKLLVTMETVRLLVEASRQGAAIFGTPPPGPDAVPALAAMIGREWPSVDAEMRDALSNAQRYLPHAMPYLDRAEPWARARLVADYRGRILANPDAMARQFRLAEVMAFVGETGFKNQSARLGAEGGGGGGGNALAIIRNAQNHQAIMDRAGRSLMMQCGPPAGAVMGAETRQFCQPSLH